MSSSSKDYDHLFVHETGSNLTTRKRTKRKRCTKRPGQIRPWRVREQTPQPGHLSAEYRPSLQQAAPTAEEEGSSAHPNSFRTSHIEEAHQLDFALTAAACTVNIGDSRICPVDSIYAAMELPPSSSEMPLSSPRTHSVAGSGSNVTLDDLDFLSQDPPGELGVHGQGSSVFAPPLALIGNHVSAPPALERSVRPSTGSDMLYVAPAGIVHGGSEGVHTLTRTQNHNLTHDHARVNSLDLDIGHDHNGHVGEVQTIELQACRHTQTAVTQFEISIVYCAECGTFDLVCERLRLT